MNQLINCQLNKLKQFVGKKNIIQSIQLGIEVAKKTQGCLDHCLFYGPAGVGKTTLARLIAAELKVKIKIIQGSSIQSMADLMTFLSSIQKNDVLFIDELHSLNKQIAELLYPIMEDYVLHITIGKAYSAKIVNLKVPPFTLIGATTNLGDITKPLEERFGYVFYLDAYNEQELKEIILQNLHKTNLNLTEQEIELIVLNSRGIPRNSNRLLKRIYEHKILEKNTSIKKIIIDAGYYHEGLTKIDLNYLLYLSESHNWTASLKSISQSLNLDEKTIVEKIETFLIKKKYIQKSSKGRFLTNQGFQCIYEQKKWIK